MKRTKTGGLHFETEAEVRNFLKLEMNSKKIHERARNREHIINYNDKPLKMYGILKALRRLPKQQHREGKILIETKLKCTMERDKLMKHAQLAIEPSQKQYFLNRANNLTNDYIYAWFIKDWGYPLEKILAIEKRTLDAISDKLNIAIPLTFGEIGTQGGI